MHGVSCMQCVSQFDPDIFTLSHSLTAHSKYSNLSAQECKYSYEISQLITRRKFNICTCTLKSPNFYAIYAEDIILL